MTRSTRRLVLYKGTTYLLLVNKLKEQIIVKIINILCISNSPYNRLLLLPFEDFRF